MWNKQKHQKIRIKSQALYTSCQTSKKKEKPTRGALTFDGIVMCVMVPTLSFATVHFATMFISIIVVVIVLSLSAVCVEKEKRNGLGLEFRYQPKDQKGDFSAVHLPITLQPFGFLGGCVSKGYSCP